MRAAPGFAAWLAARLKERLRFDICLPRFPALPTYTLASPVSAETDVRKSRFIALAIPVADRDAAMHELERLRAEHPGATHVCWALLAGGQSGMSDDGEPSGTAGRPILEVLRHHEVDGVLAAVVRYYGGIKLGAGGLVRAYTDAIASAMQLAERVERVERGLLEIAIDYADEARVRRWIEQHGAELVHSEYEMAVRLVVRMPVAAREPAAAELRDLTNGRAEIGMPT
ncbi:putative uncharacterized protein [Caballeronia insecticola]|uniref:Impact N-terminal domain-containing protein n=1 Tax=Caballeronia insecticola TaxID=758793 RepID=R4WGE9_9BURK|nr:putative uncharacterized protein [Caballeronia insecticola]